MSAEFENLIGLLAKARIHFVLVGGLAAIAHGSARATFDVDVVYARGTDNIQRLAEALRPIHP